MLFPKPNQAMIIGLCRFRIKSNQCNGKGLFIMKSYVLKVQRLSKEKQELIDLSIDAGRFTWNQLTDMWLKRTESARKFEEEHNLKKYTIKDVFSKYDYSYMLQPFKQEYPWLNKVDVNILRQTSAFFADTVQKYLNRTGGKPHFKSRFAPNQSFSALTSKTSKGRTARIVKKRYLILPKIGVIKVSDTSRIEDAPIKLYTVKRHPDHKYTVSIVIDYEPDELEKTGESIGIDVNVRNMLTLSDGTKFAPFTDQEDEEKAKQWQKKYSRRRHNADVLIAQDKNRGALIPRTLDNFKNVDRARIEKYHYQRKLAAKRKFYQDQITTAIVKHYDIIVIEDLSIKKMLKNQYLSKSIANQAWYQFRNMLDYKCDWYGKTLIVVNPANTTRTCHDCGYLVDHEIRKQHWTCPNCKTFHDSDINAAKNILDLGLKQKEN